MDKEYRVSLEKKELLVKAFSEQANEVQVALSLNKSQLAEILLVSRPTVYSWFDGTTPQQENSDRLLKLLKLMFSAGINSTCLLNRRFVKQPVTDEGLSLIEILKEDDWNEAAVLKALSKAKELTSQLARQKKEKEIILKSLGYKELSADEKKDRLDTNLTLAEWDD